MKTFSSCKASRTTHFMQEFHPIIFFVFFPYDLHSEFIANYVLASLSLLCFFIIFAFTPGLRQWSVNLKGYKLTEKHALIGSIQMFYQSSFSNWIKHNIQSTKQVKNYFTRFLHSPDQFSKWLFIRMERRLAIGLWCQQEDHSRNNLRFTAEFPPFTLCQAVYFSFSHSQH